MSLTMRKFSFHWVSATVSTLIPVQTSKTGTVPLDLSSDFVEGLPLSFLAVKNIVKYGNTAGDDFLSGFV